MRTLLEFVASPSAASVPIWYRSRFPSFAFTFLLISSHDPWIDRVAHANSRAQNVHTPTRQQERRFYFIGRANRRVIFSVLAASLDEARQKFRASGPSDSDALFIIKTETEIYLA